LIVKAGNGAQYTFALGGADYANSSWTVTADDSGSGSYIVDPPAAVAAASHAATVVAGPNDELLLGGGGDTFVFAPLMGDDAIADMRFDPTHGPVDVIDLKAFHFATYQALLNATSDTAEGEVITLGGHSLVLEGVHKSDLHSDLFHL
jgi:hypothetical protein